jgi:5-(hydroxymethyl)furfural/furfural oxidase
MGYLDRETRKRANLTISTNTQVKELLFEGTQCVGVKALVDGREQEFRGREIILSVRRYHSPAHLLRAGIGPVGHLKEMGIPVLMGLAGVGQRLMDHPSIALSSYVRRGARMNAHTRRHIQMGLALLLGACGRTCRRHVRRGPHASRPGIRSASRSPRCSPSSTRPIRRPGRSNSPRATRGQTDRRVQPAVRQRDLDRLMSGFRKMAGLQMSAPLKAVTDKPFPAAIPTACARSAWSTPRTRILTAIAAVLMDGPAALRHYMIDNFVVEGFTFEQVMSDDEALEAFVRKAAIGVWHASCSCRMGRADDPMAVVDTQGRVKGVQGLRVVDASIFPVVPCANTNFPVLMSAEKIADAMQ